MLQITYGAPIYRLRLLRDSGSWTIKLHVIGWLNSHCSCNHALTETKVYVEYRSLALFLSWMILSNHYLGFQYILIFLIALLCCNDCSLITLEAIHCWIDLNWLGHILLMWNFDTSFTSELCWLKPCMFSSIVITFQKGNHQRENEGLWILYIDVTVKFRTSTLPCPESNYLNLEYPYKHSNQPQQKIVFPLGIILSIFYVNPSSSINCVLYSISGSSLFLPSLVFCDLILFYLFPYEQTTARFALSLYHTHTHIRIHNC